MRQNTESTGIPSRFGSAPSSSAAGLRELTAEILADHKTPHSARLCPLGKHVVYCLQSASNPEENILCDLWKAEVGKELSAKQITYSDGNNEMPQWSPDGMSIAFVSDRLKRGKSSAIYIMTADGSINHSTPHSEDKITACKWSPDGKRIAFSQHASGNEDPRVSQFSGKLNRLRSWNLETNQVETLFAEPKHVHKFVWGSRSDRLYLVLYDSADLSAPYYTGAQIVRLTLPAGHKPEHIAFFDGAIADLNFHNQHLYLVATVHPNYIASAMTVWRVIADPEHGSSSTPEQVLPAVNETVSRISELKSCSRTVAALIEVGLQDRICHVDGSDDVPIYSSPSEISTWDLKLLEDEGSALVIGTSLPNSPPELYSVQGDDLIQLSDHGSELRIRYRSRWHFTRINFLSTFESHQQAMEDSSHSTRRPNGSRNSFVQSRSYLPSRTLARYGWVRCTVS